MNSWQIALLVLVALFVGMCVPVLLQFRSALLQMQRQIDALGRDLQPTLADARLTAQHVRELSEGVAGRGEDLEALMHSAGDLARALDRLRNTTHVASAVAAAVASAVRAFREVQREPQDTASPESSEVAQSAPPKDGPPYDRTPELHVPPTESAEPHRGDGRSDRPEHDGRSKSSATAEQSEAN